MEQLSLPVRLKARCQASPTPSIVWPSHPLQHMPSIDLSDTPSSETGNSIAGTGATSRLHSAGFPYPMLGQLCFERLFLRPGANYPSYHSRPVAFI
jgi:hypothetical protein